MRRRGQHTGIRTRDPLLPRFLLGFAALVVVGSLGLIPRPVGAALNDVARMCLVVAIAGVGLKTSPLEPLNHLPFERHGERLGHVVVEFSPLNGSTPNDATTILT